MSSILSPRRSGLIFRALNRTMSSTSFSVSLPLLPLLHRAKQTARTDRDPGRGCVCVNGYPAVHRSEGKKDRYLILIERCVNREVSRSER